MLVAALVVLQVAAAPVVAASSLGGQPEGMVGVPDSAVTENVPDYAQGKMPEATELRGATLTDAHADTLEVEITTRAAANGRAGACSNPAKPDPAFCESPTLALNITDDVNAAGRQVAVPKEALRDALGYDPTTAHVVHESGETYAVQVRERGSFYVFGLAHFSTNTVTFTGSVELGGGPATDGTTYQYDLSDMDAASAPELTFTGREATEWDNASGAGLTNGDTLAVNPAGDEIRGPANGEPEVVFTGEGFERQDSATGTNSPGASVSLDVDGNLAPTGPSVNNTPELTVTGRAASQSTPYAANDLVRWFAGNWGGTLIESETRIDNPPDTLSEIRFTAGTDYGSGDITVDVYIMDGEGPDGIVGEGTKVASGVSFPAAAGQHTIPINAYSPSSNQITVEVVTTNAATDTAVKVNGDDSPTGTWFYANEEGGTLTSAPEVSVHDTPPSNLGASGDDGTSASLGDFADGETKTVDFTMSEDITTLDWSGSGGSFDWSLNWTERAASQDPAVDLDGDGAADVSHSGLLHDGETASYAAPGLTVGDDTATVSTGGGSSVGVDVRLEEVVKTRDPTADLNGNETTHFGTLAPGETANYTLSESSLRSGTNRLNVTVGDGTLSADAPTPAVGLEYSHDARDDQSVEFNGETWSERYDVNRTWGDASSNATMTVPFAGNVVHNRDVRVFINGTETAPTYSVFSGTTLEVGLGDLNPGTTTRVVANGSKVIVANGSIQVLEPTTQGNDLNTRFEITSKSEGFRIDVSGTSPADRVHYLANASWTPTEAYSSIENAGSDQYVYAPNASAGGIATARTLPLSVNPQNDVRVEVADPSEPRFELAPGAVAGDSVELTYYDTVSGTTYELYDVSNDAIVGKDTAESPVVFSLDSDDSGIYAILVDDSTGSSGGGGGGGARERVTDMAGSDPLANPILVIVVAAAVVLVGAWVASRTSLPFTVVGGVGVLVALGTLEVLQPGTVTGPVAGFLGTVEQVGPALWLGGGAIALWAFYRTVKKVTSPDRTILQVRSR